MTPQSPQQTSKLFSIRNKLILVGCLFLGSFLTTELLGTYADNAINSATEITQLREKQTAALKLLELSITEFTLAGMDAIIDKSNGNISQVLKD